MHMTHKHIVLKKKKSKYLSNLTFYDEQQMSVNTRFYMNKKQRKRP